MKLSVNAVNEHKRNIKTSTTGWRTGSSENCARNRNLTILINGIYKNRNLDVKMNRIDIEIRTDHLISAGRPDLALIHKKKKEYVM